MISLMTFPSLLWGMLVHKIEKTVVFIQITLFLQLSLTRLPLHWPENLNS